MNNKLKWAIQVLRDKQESAMIVQNLSQNARDFVKAVDIVLAELERED